VAFQFAFLPLFSSDCEINLSSLRLLLQRCAKQKQERRRDAFQGARSKTTLAFGKQKERELGSLETFN
jgi:hypothetical protein